MTMLPKLHDDDFGPDTDVGIVTITGYQFDRAPAIPGAFCLDDYVVVDFTLLPEMCEMFEVSEV